MVFQEVSMVFQGSFKDASMLQESFKVISRVFQGNIKASKNIVEGGLEET